MTEKQRIEELEGCLHETMDVLGQLMRSMLAHPDCVEGSEFDDYTETANEQIQECEIALGINRN